MRRRWEGTGRWKGGEGMGEGGMNPRLHVAVQHKKHSSLLLQVACMAVPAACIAFEGLKQSAVLGIRAASGPLGPLTRWLMDAALPTGFYGPAIGCVVTVR
jgi:hypothetical protein